MTKDDLLKFCYQCQIRPFLREPHNDGANTYCSNGYLAIRIPKVIDNTARSKPGESPIPAVFEKFAHGHGEYEYVPLPELPNPENCPHCKGLGIQHICIHCEGGGTLEPYHAEECDKCSGSGLAKNREDGREASCWACNGTGNSPHQCILMPNGQYIARPYLALIATLPGIKISTRPDPDDDQHHALHFIFDDGEACCMPIYPERIRQ